jgi:hypothetical protein
VQTDRQGQWSVSLAARSLVVLFDDSISLSLFVLEEGQVGAGDPVPEDGERAVAAAVVRMMEVMALCSTLEEGERERGEGEGTWKERRWKGDKGKE